MQYILYEENTPLCMHHSLDLSKQQADSHSFKKNGKGLIA